jgi:hypothetical protein
MKFKNTSHKLGTGAVGQLIKDNSETIIVSQSPTRQYQPVPRKQKDNSIISSKVIRVFLAVVIIKIVVLLILL